MLKFAFKAGLLLFVGWGVYKAVTVFNLKNFKAGNFQGQVGYLSADLLRKLDRFAEELKALGCRVIISPAPGALMRFSEAGETGLQTSQHFLGNAADIMLPDGPSLKEAYAVAESIGFGGIGVYPDWTPAKGMHLDVRARKADGTPYTWAGLKRSGGLVYVGLNEGFYV